MMFGSDGPPEQHPGGGGGPASAAAASGAASEGRQLHQTPVPFSGGHKPTPRSVRIVSMQDSNPAATTATGAGAGGSRREPGDRSDDDDAGKQ